MYYNNNIDDFLMSLESHLRGRLKAGSISIYSRKIKSFLEKGYSVSDLCGGIDKLIEDYSVGGAKHDEKDHGNTKAALNKVRMMIKGDVISSFYISFKKSYSIAFSHKAQHVVEYEIKDEKILLRLSNAKKREIIKINPVNMGRLINIFETAARVGLISESVIDESLLSVSGSTCLMDVDSGDVYSYRFKDINGCSKNCLFDADKTNKHIKLQDEYDKLIKNLIIPYTI